MERVTKALLVLTVLLVAASMEVEGARVLKSDDQQAVDHPENFYGGIIGGSIPGPGFHGIGYGPNGVYIIPGFGGPNTGSVPTVAKPSSTTAAAEKP